MSKKFNKLEDLTPDPENANQGTARGLSAVEDSLEQYGGGRSIVTERDGIVLAGNKTLDRAVELGLEPVFVHTKGNQLVVVVRDDLSLTDQPAKARGLAYADNRAGQLGLAWNPEQIKRDLDEGLQLRPVFFTEDEIAAMLGQPKPKKGGQTDPDAIPEPKKTTSIVPGDVFLCGKHRVMCGDSTSTEDVGKLAAGSKADIVFTSPPYAQQRDYGKKIKDWDGLMHGVCTAMPVHDGTQVFVNLGLVHGGNEWKPYFLPWLDWMQKSWRRFGWYVWDQGFGLPGDWNGRLGPSFEFIFHFNRSAATVDKWMPKKPENIKELDPSHTMLRDPGDAVHPADNLTASLQPNKIPDSVIRITRHTGSVRIGKEKADHPAVFPVELPLFFYRTYAPEPGRIVYEPFGGSGSSLIAAEQMDHHALIMDIEPTYAQLMIDRWEAFTGQKAIKE